MGLGRHVGCANTFCFGEIIQISRRYGSACAKFGRCSACPSLGRNGF